MVSGIYKIINNVDGKLYIGSAQNLNERKKEHFSLLKNNKHYNIYLQRAVNKYGITNFKFDIIVYCNKKDLITYEQIAINSIKFNMLYNILPTAGSRFGVKYTRQQVLKMIELSDIRSRKIDVYFHETKKYYNTFRSIRDCARYLNIERKGIVNNLNGITNHYKKYLFFYHDGTILDKNDLNVLCIYRITERRGIDFSFRYSLEELEINPRFRNQHHSTSTKNSISIHSKKYKHTEESKLKISKANKNKKRSEENKNRMRNAKKEKMKSIVVYEYSSGKYINTFESIRECARKLNLHRGGIFQVLSGKYTNHKGYIFKYNPVL